MCDLVFSMQELLKIVPGIAIFPLSFYLAWKKIGESVSCSVTISTSRISAGRVSAVVVTNHKDKPITIFEIQAVSDNDITFVVEKFDLPLVIKALETVTIDAKPYSALLVDGNKWEPDLIGQQKIDIYLVTPRKTIKCKMLSHPTLDKIPEFEKYRQAIKVNKTYNGIAYNENAKYAITYKDAEGVKTAIVDIFGFINGEWRFRYNMIPAEHMLSVDGVREFLRVSRAAEALQIYGVDQLL
ncbi:MAG: hypothetical protein HGB00_02885 [Chlorobiaceae bacterium]|nr:hypothetical protein [Chlorobiaceae bacterium]